MQTSAPAAARASKTYLPEIQGLRTVAVLMVVVYHIWLDRISGGVDIFLFVSAYLIVRSATAAFDGRTVFNPVSFLVKRFARLMPPVAVTVMVTLAASLGFFPAWRWEQLLEHAWASLTYRQHDLLQAEGVDYFAVDPTVLSPFQHFWSLSLQGQAFVLWALLLLVATAAARVTGFRLRSILGAGFTVLFGLSLAYATFLTGAAPEKAYFDTEARLWEFALGSLVALVPALALTDRTARIMTGAGVALILTCGFAVPATATFPGPVALWPLIGATLVILAASRRRTDNPDVSPATCGALQLSARHGLLGHPVLVCSGTYTYTLFLTHWPVVVFAKTYWHTEELNAWQGALVIVVSGVVSWLLARGVEQPLLRLTAPKVSWRKPLTALTACTALGALGMVGSAQVAAQHSIDDPGVAAYAGWSTLEGNCPDHLPMTQHCGQTPGLSDDEPHLLFLGNSHMQQFMASFHTFAGKHDLGARSYLLPGCHYRETGEGRDATCADVWRLAAEGHLINENTTAVVVMGSVSYPDGDLIPPHLDQWISAVSHQAPVIAMRDNPRFESNIFACGQQYGVDHPSCVQHLDPSWDTPLALPHAAAVVDVTDTLCPDGVCRPADIDSNQLVFLDSHHVTEDFASSLADEVFDQIEPQMEAVPSESPRQSG